MDFSLFKIVRYRESTLRLLPSVLSSMTSLGPVILMTQQPDNQVFGGNDVDHCCWAQEEVRYLLNYTFTFSKFVIKICFR